MSRVYFSPQALADLESLLSYIASKDKSAALRMHDCIIETCTTIGEHPAITAEIEGLSLSGIRHFPVKHYQRYSIFYRLIDDRVEVIRLGYGGRNWENIL